MTLKPTQPEGEFACVTGTPGESTRVTGLFRVLWPVLLLLLLMGYMLGVALPPAAMSPMLSGFLLLMITAALAAALNYSRERLSRHLQGARGEEAVARALGFLPAGYHVFHGMKLEGSPFAHDFDHVVAGPSGLFIVETKNWGGQLSVRDGQIRLDGERPPRSPTEQVLAAAHSLSEWLREDAGVAVTVQPVLCFVNNRLGDEKTRKLGDVSICGLPELRAWILSEQDSGMTPGVRERLVVSLQGQVG